MNCSVKFLAPSVTSGLPRPGLPPESACVDVVEPPDPPELSAESSPPQANTPSAIANAAKSAHIFLYTSGSSFDGGGADVRRPVVRQPQSLGGHGTLQSGKQHFHRQGEHRDADRGPQHSRQPV